MCCQGSREPASSHSCGTRRFARGKSLKTRKPHFAKCGITKVKETAKHGLDVWSEKREVPYGRMFGGQEPHRNSFPYAESTVNASYSIPRHHHESHVVVYHVIVVALLIRNLSSFSTSFKPCSCRTLYLSCENLCHQIHKPYVAIVTGTVTAKKIQRLGEAIVSPGPGLNVNASFMLKKDYEVVSTVHIQSQVEDFCIRQWRSQGGRSALARQWSSSPQNPALFLLRPAQWLWQVRC